MTSDNSLSVIVVTYNSENVIRACLEPLVPAITEVGIEIIVVDNNSGDRTLEIVKEVSKEIRIVRNLHNDGFSKAVNIGARTASGSALFLLNPDAVISPKSLIQLWAAASPSSPSILAPLIVHPGDRLRIVSAGRFPSTWRMFCHYSGLSRFGKISRALQGHYLLPDQLAAENPTDWVTGACMFIPRQIWDRLGGLSERWFMYAEDIDFCWRARLAGYPVILLSGVHATHSVGESTHEPKSHNAAWITNLFDFYKVNMDTGTFSRHIWKTVVVAGLWSRGVAFEIRSTKSGVLSERRSWHEESRRFFSYATQLNRVKS